MILLLYDSSYYLFIGFLCLKKCKASNLVLIFLHNTPIYKSTYKYDNKLDNLEEMDKFIEKYNLPRLNQDEIEKMNEPNPRSEIETVI